jgi:hypothetical protein
MNKLTRQTVYVPVSVKDELPECDSQHNLTFLSKTVAILTDEGLNATEYYHKIDSSHKLVEKGWNHQGDFNEITHWLKEQNNKYIFSEEELRAEIKRAYMYGQRNAEMMEAGLERDEVEDYVNYRML